MTDTVQRTANGQFCGNCGAAVRSYWNSCASCATPLEVTPVGDYTEEEPVVASAPPQVSRPAPAPTPGYGLRADITPQPGYPAPPAGYPAPPAEYPAAPQGGYAAPSPQAGYAAPQPGYGYGAAAPQGGYAPPPADYAAPGQFPMGSIQPTFSRDDSPRWSSSRSGPPWLVIVIALVVLLIGVGGFAGYNATKLSSSNSHLSDTKAALKTTETQLAAAKSGLAQAQSQLSNSQATVASQGAQIGAYKTCISDLSVADAATSQSQFNTDEIQSAKDCLPLGLS